MELRIDLKQRNPRDVAPSKFLWIGHTSRKYDGNIAKKPRAWLESTGQKKDRATCSYMEKNSYERTASKREDVGGGNNNSQE